MNPLLEAALKYAEMGLSVIPIKPGDKKPLIKWEAFQERKADRNSIISWWSSDPKANIGIVTGPISNLAVVDIDTEEGKQNILEYIPDSTVTPTSKTPRGGNHLFFSYPEGLDVGNNARTIPGCDFRGRGGYVLVPPSANGNGKQYEWVIPFSRPQDLMPLPEAYIKRIISTILLYGRDKVGQNIYGQGVTSVTTCDIWKNGVRDENLFHVAHCLTKTGNDQGYIRQTLRAIIASWGETDERWIDAKIKSAFERSERHERNIQAEIDAFISVTDRDWSVTQLDKELGIVTKRDMDSRRKALSRRKDVTIEKTGQREGWWRRIDTDVEVMDFNEPEGVPYPILLPFDLHSMVHIYEGNIILVSGEFNAGKSLFGLTTLVSNKNRVPIRYLSSEMKVPEIKGRFKWFGIDQSAWMPDENCKYLALKNNLPSLILPDGLTIIDYLEFPEGDYTRGAEYMTQIHNKLKRGVAIVCVQHKIGARLPRSGDLIMEKPRLAIALRKVDETDESVFGIAEVLKAKSPKLGKMDGRKLKYEIKNHGSMFKILIDWGFWRV